VVKLELVKAESNFATGAIGRRSGGNDDAREGGASGNLVATGERNVLHNARFDRVVFGGVVGGKGVLDADGKNGAGGNLERFLNVSSGERSE